MSFTAGTMRLVLVRHGQTLDNARRIVQGQRPGRLSDKGCEQARRLAQRLGAERFDALYSSDLDRALETARILLQGRDGPPLIADPRLREQNYGVHEGQPLADMLRQMKCDKATFAAFNPRGGEPSADFRHRLKSFLEDIKARHLGQPRPWHRQDRGQTAAPAAVVLVTHHGTIQGLVDLLFVRQSVGRIHSGAALVLEMSESEVKCSFLNLLSSD